MKRRCLTILAALVVLLGVRVLAQGLAPIARFQFFDNNGLPAAGYKLCTYAAGTSNPLGTFSDVALSVNNQNPIILNASGRPSNGSAEVGIYLSAASYKFILMTPGTDTTCGTGVAIWTQDNVQATLPFTAALLSVALPDVVESHIFEFGGSAFAPTTNTAFLSGATADKLAPNTPFWNIDSTHLSGTYALEAMLAVDNGSNTVSLEMVNITDASDVALVTITGTSTTGTRARSSTITFAAGGSAKDYGVKLKTSAGNGWAWAIRIVRTS
jgi:hypothetical protein